MTENVTYKIEGSKLIVTMDLKAPGKLSSTGKTKLIATTGAAMSIDCNGVRAGVKLALNLMVPA